MKQKIGFVGIGVMGGPIVLHLLHAGYDVVGYSRTKEKVEKQIKAGMTWLSTPQEVVASADVIFTMVGFPTDVEEIYLGVNGMLTPEAEGKIFVDMTTSQPQLAQKITEQAASFGAIALDAPVTGGDLGAINGTLSMMVGGDKETFDTLLPIFEQFCQTINYTGTSGMGQHAKMANQIAICGNLLGMAESFMYAKEMGVDLQTMLNIMGGGSASSWQLVNNGKNVLDNNFQPGFYMKHFVKDMTIALEELAAIDSTLPMLTYGHKICSELVEQELGDLGTQAIIKAYDPNF